MNYKPYTLHVNKDSTRFQFQSIGKRGVFEKVILITQMHDLVYNLALLDYEPINKTYNDLSITDNGDMPVVLSTVISSIKIFTNKYFDRSIYIRGNTSSRTRLYQISIAKVYGMLKYDFNIYGEKDEAWVRFEPNINFDSFLIQKKL